MNILGGQQLIDDELSEMENPNNGKDKEKIRLGDIFKGRMGKIVLRR
jgi:hypothetical protein